MSYGITSYGIITVGKEYRTLMPRPSRTPRTPALDRYAQRFLELKQELQNLQYFCKGTVLQRRMKCGQPGCPCHLDPSKRHGPYWEWTYKAKSKTVNVRLRAQASPIYKAASRQHRKLKSLLVRLERLSRTALLALARKAESPQHPSLD